MLCCPSYLAPADFPTNIFSLIIQTSKLECLPLANLFSMAWYFRVTPRAHLWVSHWKFLWKSILVRPKNNFEWRNELAYFLSKKQSFVSLAPVLLKPLKMFQSLPHSINCSNIGDLLITFIANTFSTNSKKHFYPPKCDKLARFRVPHTFAAISCSRENTWSVMVELSIFVSLNYSCKVSIAAATDEANSWSKF